MITEATLKKLRSLAEQRLSSFRYSHTLGVERAAAMLSVYYMPKITNELRAAALLHDITKEMPLQEQIKLIHEAELPLTDNDVRSQNTLHQTGAAAFIKMYLPEMATEDILSSVSKHTTGDVQMSTFDKLIYLADYIEDTRKHEACLQLRQRFLDGIKKCSAEEYISFLDNILLYSFKNTIKKLEESNAFIHEKTLKAYKSLLEITNIDTESE